jgi:P27 family predicted phage terminase small subunit
LRNRGTFKASRRFSDEPAPPAGAPRCPASLKGEARTEWKRITRELATLGVLATTDRAAITLWCQAWATNSDAAAKVNELGAVIRSVTGTPQINPYVSIARRSAELLVRLAAEFGLTPSARARVRALPTTPEEPRGPARFFTRTA